jgi:DNA modification methylase
MSAEIHEGDALEILRSMPDNSYHGCLTDPPYGLSFMGHGWDHGVPSVDVWREVLRVLRPGAHVLAFGGTRTFHRLTCAIEDAGFEIRDCMQWLYGSGFPKSHDVSKAIDKANGDWRGKAGEVTSSNAAMGGPNYARTPKGEPIAAAVQWSGHGTALKPAWEPIIVARKPLDGTVAQNVQRWGCGGLAIDASRVEGPPSGLKPYVCTTSPPGYELGMAKAGREVNFTDNPLGRWPANVILSHHPDCVEVGTRDVVSRAGKKGEATPGYGGGYAAQPGQACEVTSKRVAGTKYMQSETVAAYKCVDGCPVAALDAQSGVRTSGVLRAGTKRTTGGGFNGGFPEIAALKDYGGDSGGASRFFYCPKASRSERDAGLDAFELGNNMRVNAPRESESEKVAPSSRNIHPTVKPLALARYLARLILPPIQDARMVVPFCGSGSEVIGALQAGWAHVDGIDSWDVAVRISRARIEHWSSK